MAKHSPAAIDPRSNRAKAVALTWQNPEIHAARSAAISAAKKGRPGHPHTEAEKKAASVWMKRAHAQSLKRKLAAAVWAGKGIKRSALSSAHRDRMSSSVRRSYEEGRHRRM